MKKRETLTDDQHKVIAQWYDYAINIARGWASKHSAFWCIDDIVSIAGLTLVRCAFRYQDKLATGAKGFSTYLYASLIKNFKVTMMLAKGYKKVGRAAQWENPFNEVENFVFDEYICQDSNHHVFEKIDFDGIVNSSRLLKPSEKKILELLYVEDMSNAEVARKLNCSREFIRQKKERALKILRKAVEWDENLLV